MTSESEPITVATEGLAFNDQSNTLTVQARQAYAIVLNDRSYLLARLDAATAERITNDWKDGAVIGSYPAYTAADEPFTLAVRFAEVSAITAAGMCFEARLSLTAQDLVRTLQRQRG